MSAVPVWIPVVTTDLAPSPRVGNSLTYISGKVGRLILFGGANHEEGVSDELFEFNIETYKWEEILVKGKQPCVRTINSCGVISKETNKGTRSRIYVFAGGGASDVPVVDAGMYCLDIVNSESGMWIQLSDPNKSIEHPISRLGHSTISYCTSEDKWKIVVFGGMNQFEDLNELWISGHIPSPRSAHSATLILNEMFVFGGMCHKNPAAFDDIYILDLENQSWKKLEIVPSTSNGPGLRIDHSATSCIISDSVQKNAICIFGGMDFQGMYNDMYFLNFGK
ncbi:hypothetical protein HK096_010409 [Nowakowskiella sp. JEL0078]|nr:hypothetical protein HK096_010409 [Nowakowskiella sp. JEL0078]